MEKSKRSSISIFTIIGVVVTLAAAIGAVIYFFEKKKAKEEKELEEYLDNSIL